MSMSRDWTGRRFVRRSRPELKLSGGAFKQLARIIGVALASGIVSVAALLGLHEFARTVDSPDRAAALIASAYARPPRLTVEIIPDAPNGIRIKGDSQSPFFLEVEIDGKPIVLETAAKSQSGFEAQSEFRPAVNRIGIYEVAVRMIDLQKSVVATETLQFTRYSDVGVFTKRTAP